MAEEQRQTGAVAPFARGVRRRSSSARALILGAGTGTRLGADVPKCLAEVGGRPLIEWQLDILAEHGIRDVTIVVGFGEDAVREVVGRRSRYVVNDLYRETNSLYSFFLAREVIATGGFVLNADVLFHPSVLARLNVPGDGAVAFDSASGTEPEHMKVEHCGNRLVAMRKDMEAHRACGENLGVLRLGRRAARTTIAAAEAIIRAGGGREWLSSAINLAAAAHTIECVDVAGTPWIEIDYPEDLDRARTVIWPRIDLPLPGLRLRTTGLQPASGGGSLRRAVPNLPSTRP